jgi:hypothetical protein
VVKVKHATMRRCPISLRGTVYRVDGEGCVDVSDDHASFLVGPNWTKVGSMSRPEAAPEPTPEASSTEKLDTMLKSELLELAESMGLEVDPKVSKIKLVAEIRQARKEK